MIRLSAPVTLAAETGARTIEGMAIHYDQVVHASTGPVMFLAGSLPTEGTAPKLLRDHDPSQPLGLVTERWATPDGVAFRAKISATAAGDEALTLAADGVLDSVSVGVQPVDFIRQDGVMVVAAGAWMELSLLPWGADPNAKISHVAASPAEVEESTTPNPNPSEEEPMSENIEAAPAEVVATAPIFAAPAKPITAADYISAVASGRITPAIKAVIAEQGLADTPGILPEPLVGSVFNNLNNRRPFIDSIGSLAMPSASVWYRRKITQHVSVDDQAAEFDELASQKMTIAKIQVDPTLAGGVVAMSEQEIDWTDPAAVQLVLNDFGTIWAKHTETKACAALVAGATVTDTITSWTDADEILDAMYDATVTIGAAIDELPTHLWVSPNRWATLGKAKFANGERMFPVVGPMNAAGTSSPGSYTIQGLGLTVVVSPRFASNTAIIGSPVGIEHYEQNKGILRVDVPETASVKVALRGYHANAIISAGAFVKFV